MSNDSFVYRNNNKFTQYLPAIGNRADPTPFFLSQKIDLKPLIDALKDPKGDNIVIEDDNNPDVEIIDVDEIAVSY